MSNQKDEHIFLSNCRTGALLLDGEIDWLPFPRFDSKTIFAKILDKNAGSFSIKPTEKYTVASAYIGNSLAIKSTFTTAKGKLTLTDYLPLNLPAIIRLYESEIPFTAEINPVFNYGRDAAKIETEHGWIRFTNKKSKEGIEVVAKGDYTFSEGKLDFQKGNGYISAFYSEDMSQRISLMNPLAITDPYQALSITQEYFEYEAGKAKRVSKFSEAYMRSIAVSIGCMYAPSGSIIASPTTSLPEILGGQRNWDYRYAWIRDSSYAAQAFSKAGLYLLSRRILSFLVSVIDASTKSFSHTLYTIDGNAPQPEEEANWLSGYMDSKPVRIGNAAYMQLQMDSEGNFMNALYSYFKESNDISFISDNWWAINAIGLWSEQSWHNKSTSLWEEREDLQHFVQTKVMEWVALDRCSKLATALGKQKEAQKFKASSEELKEEIIQNGYSKEQKSFVRYYGSTEVDAALLTLPLYGFIDAKDPKFISTFEKIIQDLHVGDGFLIRYKEDSMGKLRHPFTLLSLWFARICLRLGDKPRTENIIKNVLSYSTKQGLIAEHVDYQTHEQRGNFPQLFPHSGIIETLIEYDENAIPPY